MRRATLLVLVLGLLAGCGGPIAGEPVAAGTSRPRDIRLDGLDPCKLFTPEVQAKLGLDRPPQLDRGASYVFQGVVPMCAVRRAKKPGVTVSVQFGLLDGIELFTPERVAGALEPRVVRGFPALLLPSNRNKDSCAVVVDVAPGQVLAVLFADGGDTPPIPELRLCAGAEQAADLTVAALLSQA